MKSPRFTLLQFGWLLLSPLQGQVSFAQESSSAPVAPAVVEDAGAAPAPPKPELIPKAFPAERYAGLIEKSPFAVASAPPEVVAPVENFATNWVLTGLSKHRGKDGNEAFTVFVRSRDASTRLVISADRPAEDISLVAVEEAPVPVKSVAILKKGAETGRVEFDQASVAAVPVPQPQQAPGSKPPGAPTGVPAVRTSSKGTGIPRPGLQGSVPRPGASQVPGAMPAAPQPGAPAGQEPRKRVRPIQEPP